ncbi:thioredoxin domain-containing protein 11-like [Labeo rohita]|uniref:thioredoxin domain-containing protein 11-like n=1 Tax=Labeo rohita TaxID=84645 RepID=UPI0021E2BCCD|nr:thioredoxin domain-containing protein 11-like [Labeo rohita]
MDSQRDVLLLYYSAWCGFCSVLNHVFLQLARLFQGNGALTVARVNVGRNDLPWEFMVDHHFVKKSGNLGSLQPVSCVLLRNVMIFSLTSPTCGVL